MSATQKDLIDYCNARSGNCSDECRYDGAECEAFIVKHGGTPYLCDKNQPYLYTDEVLEAVEAVEAAEKEGTTACSTDDTISRLVAIETLERQLDYLHMLNKDENPTAESKWYGVNWARNTIADLPPTQPEPRWIPVSKELPDVGQAVLLSTTRGHALAGYRLEPSSLYLVTDDEDGKDTWVYDPDSYTDTYGDAVNDLPRSEDCGFSDMADSYSFLAVTSPNYDARFQGVTAWMPMPESYKEVEKHGTD